MLSAVTDQKTGKIPNFFILAGYGLGLLSHSSAGMPGVAGSIGSAIGILILLYPLYYIRGLGAGDIKLLSVTASVISISLFLKILFLSFLIGAVISLFRMIKTGQLFYRLWNLKMYAETCLCAGKIEAYATIPGKQSYLHFAVCIAAAGLMVLMGEVRL